MHRIRRDKKNSDQECLLTQYFSTGYLCGDLFVDYRTTNTTLSREER